MTQSKALQPQVTDSSFAKASPTKLIMWDAAGGGGLPHPVAYQAGLHRQSGW